jgi:hypothetical protein
MKRLLALIALFALPAAGLACDDDSGDSATTTDEATDEETISLADWIDQADQVCAANDAEVDDVEAPQFGLDEDLSDEQLQEAADYFNEIAAIEQDTVDSLRDLPTPDEGADEVNDTLDLVQGALDDTRAAADAAEDGDQDGLEESLDSAGQQFDDAGEMAADIGLQECGQPGSNNTTGDNTGTGGTGA